MATQLILLERVEKLGNMGDMVSVKPGYARNFLIPQKKALRASKSNIAYFESRKKHLEADNDKRRTEAEKQAKKLEGLKVILIRQASESGQLYGSVTSRDIAEEASSAFGEEIARSMIDVNQNYKLIGLFPIDVILHPEVKAEIIINIARSSEEAEIQAKSGKALIADRREVAEEEQAPLVSDVPDEDALEGILEDGALEAEKERQADAEDKAVQEAEKVEARAVAKAEKEEAAKAAQAALDAETEGEADEATSSDEGEES